MANKPSVPSKRTLAFVAAFITAAVVVLGVFGSGTANAASVPGQSGARYDSDKNGYPDAGLVVSGNYTDSYADPDGVCEVRVNYRGAFENDPYMDSGWIQNHYRCVAPDGTVSTYEYLIVNESDPRYTGNPDTAVWGNWEYKVLTESGSGNLVRPATHVS